MGFHTKQMSIMRDLFFLQRKQVVGLTCRAVEGCQYADTADQRTTDAEHFRACDAR